MGGEGLIGSALVSSLIERGSEVTSLDLKSGCDLRKAGSLHLDDCDRIWFLAWDTGGASYIEAEDRQHAIFRNNCDLAARVFDSLSASRRPFLFTTSQLAGQASAYGLTKLMGEAWARQLGGKIARLWNVYGWEQPGIRSHVVTDLVLRGLQTTVVHVRTSGRERRRLLYKDDCVEALVRLFESPEQEADIAGPEWVPIFTVAGAIAKLLGAEVSYGQADGQEMLVEPRKPLGGWQPHTSLVQGLSLVIEDARRFLRESPAARPPADDPLQRTAR